MEFDSANTQVVHDELARVRNLFHQVLADMRATGKDAIDPHEIPGIDAICQFLWRLFPRGLLTYIPNIEVRLRVLCIPEVNGEVSVPLLEDMTFAVIQGCERPWRLDELAAIVPLITGFEVAGEIGLGQPYGHWPPVFEM